MIGMTAVLLHGETEGNRWSRRSCSLASSAWMPPRMRSAMPSEEPGTCASRSSGSATPGSRGALASSPSKMRRELRRPFGLCKEQRSLDKLADLSVPGRSLAQEEAAEEGEGNLTLQLDETDPATADRGQEGEVQTVTTGTVTGGSRDVSGKSGMNLVSAGVAAREARGLRSGIASAWSESAALAGNASTEIGLRGAEE
mmetsp:Transcript_20598/g.48875  ORF Transcript_20598/g.48875 Transcript_20598/m.48875 type:complete len:199 (-) Transcript_20598:763-1359(-)